MIVEILIFLVMNNHILLVEPFLPYPLKSGGHQAIYNGLKSIESLFDRIYLTFYVNENNLDHRSIDELKKQVHNLEIIPCTYRKSTFVRLFRRIFPNLSFNKKKVDPFNEMLRENVYPLPFLEHINNLIEKKGIDVVQVEMPWCMSIVTSLPRRVKKIYVHHELRFVRNQLQLETCGNNFFRESAVEINKILEIGLLNKYDAIITLSEIDKNKLKGAGVIKPIYSSFAIVRTQQLGTNSYGSHKTLSFVGPEQHVPNKVGILWFLNNCWGKLLARDPDFKLQIFSRWSEGTIKKIEKAYPSVEFKGFAPDLREVLRGTTMIVPITIGSGIRMKILEASSIGVPFVSTTVGAEGLPFKCGEDCFLTDDSDVFVEDILALEDIELRKKFITNSYNIVSSHYSLEALKENRKEIFDKIIYSYR